MKFNLQGILKLLGVSLLVLSLSITSVGMTSLAMYSEQGQHNLEDGFFQDEEMDSDDFENENLKLAARQRKQFINEVSGLNLNNQIASSSNANAATLVTTEEELVAAIDKANDGDVIEIYGEIYLSETIFINTSITLKQLQWAIIYAPENARHFSISGEGVNVTMQNLMLDGQKIGGGIECHGASLVLDYSNIVDCYVSGDGGGVYIAGILTVIDTAFDDNHATGNGGAIYSAPNSVLNFSDAGFYENKATNGGAVYAFETSIYIDDIVVFAENCASNDGGAIYLESGSIVAFSEKTEKMTSVFVQNRAGNGGAIYALNSDIYSNEMQFYWNKAAINGGAIYSDSGTMVLENKHEHNYFEWNRAINGGGIYAYNTEMIFGMTNFMDHRATGNGGVIYADSSTILFKEQEFESCFGDNKAIDSGGAVYALKSTIYFPPKTYFVQNVASNQGGNIYVSESMIHLQQVEMWESRASFGGAIYGEDSQIDIEASQFFYNQATVDGGAIYTNSLKNLRIYGETEFEENEAQDGVHIEDGYYINLHNELIAPSVSWTNEFDYVYNNFDVGFSEAPLETYTVTIITQYIDNIVPNEEKTYHVYAGAEFKQEYDCLEAYQLAGASVRSVNPMIDGITQTVYIERVERDYTITVYLMRKTQTIDVTLHYLDGALPDETKSYHVSYGDSFEELFTVADGYHPVEVQLEAGMMVFLWNQTVYVESVTKDMTVTIICQ